jgi:hypothetical protein
MLKGILSLADILRQGKGKAAIVSSMISPKGITEETMAHVMEVSRAFSAKR